MSEGSEAPEPQHQKALENAREQKRYPGTKILPFGREEDGITVKGDFHASVADTLREHGFEMSHRAGDNVIFWPEGDDA